MSSFELDGDGCDEPINIADLELRKPGLIAATISSSHTVRIGDGVAYICRVSDGSAEIDLIFLARAQVAGLTPGTFCYAKGTFGLFLQRRAMLNPFYLIVDRPKNSR